MDSAKPGPRLTRRYISHKTFLGLGAVGSMGFLIGCGAEQTQGGSEADSLYFGEEYRPRFHFSPESNWINDLVYYDGEYHMFFQYNPYEKTQGNLSWGHAVSEDLLRWEELPVALEPDEFGLIFSGSAVVDREDTSGFFGGEPGLVAIYTNHDEETEEQIQSIAYSTDRGRTWTKYSENPVIPNPGIKDFRDPKVIWHEETKRWVLALAAGDRAMFYSSQDLKSWTELSEFGAEDGGERVRLGRHYPLGARPHNLLHRPYPHKHHHRDGHVLALWRIRHPRHPVLLPHGAGDQGPQPGRDRGGYGAKSARGQAGPTENRVLERADG